MTAPAPGGGRSIAILAGPVAATALLLFGDLAPDRPEIDRTAAVALWMAIWWITEAVPLAVTSLLPVVLLPALGVMNGKDVASEYFNHIVFLFLGGFIVALAIERWGLHRRIALRTLLLFGARPARILLGFMVTTALLSMWISNTATAMMMVTIVLAVVKKIEEGAPGERARRYVAGLLIGVAWAASIGGIATLVGTPPNLSFARIFERTFPDAPMIDFASWMAFALPITLVMLAIGWVVLTLAFVPRGGGLSIDRDHLEEEAISLGAMSREERAILVAFGALVGLWLFRADIDLGAFVIPGWSNLLSVPGYVNDGSVAVAVALALFVLPTRRAPSGRLMDWETAQKIPWHIILLFGGGFALATAFAHSGLSDWLGERLKDGAPSSPLLLVGVLCIGVTFLTELTSNIATTEMLLPVVAGLARALEMNPLALMVPVTMSCSCAFMMPVATPPNAIVFGSERIRIAEMARVGVVMNLIGAVVITAVALALGPLVLGIDADVFPDWAK